VLRVNAATFPTSRSISPRSALTSTMYLITVSVSDLHCGRSALRYCHKYRQAKSKSLDNASSQETNQEQNTRWLRNSSPVDFKRALYLIVDTPSRRSEKTGHPARMSAVLAYIAQLYAAEKRARQGDVARESLRLLR
jgi:hypothetical protein